MSKKPKFKGDVEACYWSGSNTDGILDLKKYAAPGVKFEIEVTGPLRAPVPTGVLEVQRRDGTRLNVPVGTYVVLDFWGDPHVFDPAEFEREFEDLP